MIRNMFGRKSRARRESDQGCSQDGEFTDSEEAQLHPDAHDDGGLACSNAELLEVQRNAVMEVFKSLAGHLLTGNLDLTKVSLPVKMFEPRSFLQKMTDPWVYPRYLTLAAQSSDPLQRLQWVVTYFMAGFHLVFARWAKPFNPVLGETWQAALPDGSAIALEQISHHPPITAFQMQGPRSPGGAPTYTFTGHSQPCVSFKPSSTAVKTTARGFRVLDFADGGRIEVHFPAYYLKGLLYNSGLRGEVTGTAEFVDVQHGLRAVVCFGRVEAGQTATLRRSDAFSGCVYRSRLPPPQQQQQQQQPALGRDSAVSSSSTSSSGWQRPTTTSTSEMAKRRVSSSGSLALRVLSLGLRGSKSTPAVAEVAAAAEGAELHDEVVARCSGNWLSHLDWGAERWWTLLEEAAVEWQPVESPLPSDSRYRRDLALLAEGDVKQAQVAKEVLEQRQRADAKLRKAALGEGH